MIILFGLILALVILVVDVRVTDSNTDTPYNGFGSIDLVLRGESQLPMQQRVFIPWLTFLLGWGRVNYWVYLFVKYCGIVLMLGAFYFYLYQLHLDAVKGVLILSALVPIAILYDYADAYWDLGLWALVLGLLIAGGPLWLIAILSFIAGLNRETAIFIGGSGIFFAPVAGLVAIVAAGIGSFLPAFRYRKHERYCSFVRLDDNWELFQKMGLKPIYGYFHAVLFVGSFFSFTIVNGHYLPGLYPTMVIMTFFVVSMMIPSIWSEIRVFLPLLLVIIPLMLV